MVRILTAFSKIAPPTHRLDKPSLVYRIWEGVVGAWEEGNIERCRQITLFPFDSAYDCSTFCSNTYAEFEEPCFGGPCINLLIYIYRPSGRPTFLTQSSPYPHPQLHSLSSQEENEEKEQESAERASLIPGQSLPREHLSLRQTTVTLRLLPQVKLRWSSFCSAWHSTLTRRFTFHPHATRHITV